jgi:hypothetical protein
MLNPVSILGQHGVGVDLNRDLGGNQAADFHHVRGRANVLEEFAVGFADLLPVVDLSAGVIVCGIAFRPS